MKLKYWVAVNKYDDSCYNIRKKTKKEVLEEITKREEKDRYTKPRRIEIEYTDPFDLLTQLVGEAGITSFEETPFDDDDD
jgi:hypothetical protein